MLVLILGSIIYIAYVLVFTELINRVSGSEPLALFVLAGSLLLEAVLEIPTGAFADYYSYHLALKFSFTALFFHALFFLIAAFLSPDIANGIHSTELGLIIVGEVLAAFGLALYNGSLNSWFVTSIRSEGYTGELTSFMSRQRLSTNLTWLLVGLFTLLLRSSSLSGPLLIVVVSYLAGFFVTVKLIGKADLKDALEPLSISHLYKITKDEFYGALGATLKNRKLLVVAITYAVFSTLMIIITYFWQQLLGYEPNDNSFLIYTGAIYLFFSLGRIMGSAIASRIKAHQTHKRDSRVLFFIIDG